MRLKAGLSLEQAALKLDLTRSGLHRLEAGVTRAHVHIARSMMDLYDQYVPDLLDTIRLSRRRGWWQDYQVANRDYLGWEAGAETLCEFAVVRVPDLLQTEDYARSLLASRVHPADEVRARSIRQHRLMDPHSTLAFTTVIDESALRNQVGNASVMRGQLEHLIECAERANVSVRVLPASVGAAIRCAGFRLLEFSHPDDSPVLYADCAHAGVREERSEEVAKAVRSFDAIGAAALSEQDSAAFIRRVLRELYPADGFGRRYSSAS